MKTTTGLLLLLAATCHSVLGQSTVIMEAMTITPGGISTDSETEMDYSTAQYYCAVADGYLWENGSVTTSGEASAGLAAYEGYYICPGTAAYDAILTFSVSTDANASYEMQTNHWLEAAYTVYDGDDFEYYYDPYGYSGLTAQEDTGQGTVTPPETEEYPTSSYSFWIGSTYLLGTSSTHVNVTYDNQGAPAACLTTGVWVRQMIMQLVTGSNVAITSNVPIAETFSGLTTNTCGTGVPVPAACTATGGGIVGAGQFLDSMTVSGNFCGSGVSQGSGCGYSQTSTWAACGSGLTNNIWTSPRTTLSDGVTVNSNSTQFAVGTQLYP